jgi:two-component system nitrate/nitrite response regulator NarL
VKAIYADCADAGILARWREFLAGNGLELRPWPAQGGSAPTEGDIGLIDLGSTPVGEVSAEDISAKLDPRLRWVVMTPRPAASEGLAWLRGGARGYCNRLLSAGALAAVLDTVEAGKVWAGPEVNDYLLQTALAPDQAVEKTAVPNFDALTPRERTIAEQVAAGRSNKVIAIDAGISERTVKAHLNAIFRKTGLRNRVQLALAMSSEPNSSVRSSSG